MSILTRIGSLFSKRSQERPADDDDRWYSPFIAQTASGVRVTPEMAVGTAAFYSVVSAIAQTIGCMPLLTYERLGNGGRDRAVKSPFYFLFSAQPNDWMTSGEWVEMVLIHLCLAGNAYNFKLRDRSGRVTALIPLNPTRMTVRQLDDMSLAYEYKFQNGTTRYMSQREVMHFRFGFSDGIVGRSPITVARETAALTMACERYAGKFFKNGTRPSGVLTHPEALTKESSDRIRESWQRANAGEDEAWKVTVLEEGMKFEPITMSAQDCQFIEQRRFQLEEAARLFRVPPHIVGDLSRATFSNIEQQSINFVVYCLQPYIKRFEQTLMLNFFNSLVNGKEMYAEFLVDGLLRGDTKTRNESYEIMRRNGIISTNEWRRLENMSPLDPEEGGDKYLVQMQMTTLDKAGELPEKPLYNKLPQAKDQVANNEQKSKEKALIRQSFAGVLNRLIYKNDETINRLQGRENAQAKIEEFLNSHETTCRAALFPHMSVYGFYRSQLSGCSYNEKLMDFVWGEFWKQCRGNYNLETIEVRAGKLSEALCAHIESVFRETPKLLEENDHAEIRTA